LMTSLRAMSAARKERLKPVIDKKKLRKLACCKDDLFLYVLTVRVLFSEVIVGPVCTITALF